MFGVNLLPSYKSIEVAGHVNSATLSEETLDTVQVKTYALQGKDTLWLPTEHDVTMAQNKGLSIEHVADTVTIAATAWPLRATATAIPSR